VEFLERNGYRFAPPESEDPDEIVASQIEALAAGSLDEGDFGRWLVDWVRREDP
jgi:prophage maintenance system killer protein